MNRSIVIAAVAFALAGCTKPSGDAPPAPTTQTPVATPSVSVIVIAQPIDAALPTAELKLSASGTTMLFDETKFYVKAGQPVHVVFENKLPGTLPHNWVLLKPGKEASYALFVVDKASDGYYADAPEVLAHTSLVAPGNKGETTFIAPTEPGDYPYICSFPGHYMMMKGVITVKAPTS